MDQADETKSPASNDALMAVSITLIALVTELIKDKTINSESFISGLREVGDQGNPESRCSPSTKKIISGLADLFEKVAQSEVEDDNGRP